MVIKIFVPHRAGVQVVIVDLEGYALWQKEWPSLIPQSGSKWRVYLARKKNYMHRILAKCFDYKQKVDHINGNSLDNRLINLRVVNNQSNCFNTASHYDSKFSQCKGVSYWAHPSGRKHRWVAQIKAGTKRLKKYFKTEREAALQYNEWAKQNHKEFAVINGPNSWESDLKFGTEAEEVFYLKHKDKLSRLDGYNGDLINHSGEKIELKTERRASTDTGNVFIEKISNTLKNSPGGPFKALLDGCKLFVVFFWKDGRFFTYNTVELVEYINSVAHTLDLKQVRVGGSRAAGYAIPIKQLEHLERPLNAIK